MLEKGYYSADYSCVHRPSLFFLECSVWIIGVVLGLILARRVIRRRRLGRILATRTVIGDTSGHTILDILLSLMKSPAGTVPKELCGLSHSVDKVAPRVFVLDSDESYRSYCQLVTQAGRYPVVELRSSKLGGFLINLSPYRRG